jgi:hypothetical protein
MVVRREETRVVLQKVDPAVVALETPDREALEALVELMVALVARIQVELVKEQRTS